MATAKTEHTDETTTPKTNIITFAKGATAADKMAALKEAQKALEDEVLIELTVQKDDLEAQLLDVNRKIEAITGPPLRMEHPAGRTRGPKKEKVQGKLVNDKILTDLITAAPDGVLNIRSKQLDIAGVKKMAEESKGKFVFTPNGPWPTVSLAK